MELRLFASELRLRGTEEVRQPHVKDGNVLCWNGEVSLPPQVLNFDTGLTYSILSDIRRTKCTYVFLLSFFLWYITNRGLTL